MKKSQEQWAPLLAGKEYDESVLSKYFQLLAEDIGQQKKRVGGDWAVATVVFKRGDRDKIRYVLHCIIMHLVNKYYYLSLGKLLEKMSFLFI